ncbi:hypothetical protein ACF06X_33610 [Streptomyces sp. NPDC015346]|uniref:hypothetical protein n=1 Tax=Streptomyces sp. NPDC015346 TaxID=3364954 RepID=UPI0036F739C4
MATITADTVADIVKLLATDEDLYDRLLGAVETLNTPKTHDGHAPEALTIERLAEDIASAL